MTSDWACVNDIAILDRNFACRCSKDVQQWTCTMYTRTLCWNYAPHINVNSHGHCCAFIEVPFHPKAAGVVCSRHGEAHKICKDCDGKQELWHMSTATSEHIRVTDQTNNAKPSFRSNLHVVRSCRALALSGLYGAASVAPTRARSVSIICTT